MPARGLEDPDGTEHVDLCIERGALDGHPDVCLRGEVEHDLRPNGVEDDVRLADVGDVQFRVGGHVLERALGEIVERVRLVTAGEQRVDEVRADEPCPPGHDRAHFPMVGATCS